MEQEHLRNAAAGSSNGRSDRAGYGQGWTIISHLIAGPLLFGVIGWLLDDQFSTSWLLPVGLLLGLLGSGALVYVRFIYPPASPAPSPGRPGDAVGETDRKEQHG